LTTSSFVLKIIIIRTWFCASRCRQECWCWFKWYLEGYGIIL